MYHSGGLKALCAVVHECCDCDFVTENWAGGNGTYLLATSYYMCMSQVFSTYITEKITAKVLQKYSMPRVMKKKIHSRVDTFWTACLVLDKNEIQQLVFLPNKVLFVFSRNVYSQYDWCYTTIQRASKREPKCRTFYFFVSTEWQYLNTNLLIFTNIYCNTLRNISRRYKV